LKSKVFICLMLAHPPLWLWFPPMVIVFYMGVDDNTGVEEDA